MKSEIEQKDISNLTIEPGMLLESVESSSKIVIAITRRFGNHTFEGICLYTEGDSGWVLYEVYDSVHIPNVDKWKVFTGTVKLSNDL